MTPTYRREEDCLECVRKYLGFAYKTTSSNSGRRDLELKDIIVVRFTAKEVFEAFERHQMDLVMGRDCNLTPEQFTQGMKDW